LSLLLAIADITLAGADLGFQAFREEILKYEGGQEFLNAWDKVYAVGGALTGGLLVVTTFYKVGLKLLVLPEIIKNVKLSNSIKTYMIKVFMEINISKFEANTVKILTEDKESFLVSGNVSEKGKIIEEYALVYKSEVIAKGNKTAFYKQVRQVGRNIYSDKKLEAYLESIINRRRVVSVEDISFLGQPPKSGTKMLFSLVDELGNRIGQLSRSPNRNELYYKLIKNGKEIDIKCYMKLLDDKYQKNLPIKEGEHLLYGDFNIPKEITDKYSGLGQIVYEDGLKYFLNAKKYGKVDGTVSMWIKSRCL
jgi:hypothetical protein